VAQSSQLSQPREVAQSSQLSQPREGTQSSQLSQPREVTQSSQLSQPREVTQSSQLSQPREVTHSSQLSQPREVTHSSHLSQPRSQDMEAESASILDLSLIVSCTCGNNHPDLLMLVCCFCSRAQHAACYRILEEAKLPAKHCCVQCSQEEEDRVCTDPKLVKIWAKPEVALTCLYRRVLAVLNASQHISLVSLTENLCISEEFAEQFIEKLLTENILTVGTGHLFDVNRQVLQQHALRKYLGIKYVEDSMVQQTEEMNIAAPVHDEVPRAAGDIAPHVPGEDGDISAGGLGEGIKGKRVLTESAYRKGGRTTKRIKASATIGGLLI
jgi:hypothetical protein